MMMPGKEKNLSVGKARTGDEKIFYANNLTEEPKIGKCKTADHIEFCCWNKPCLFTDEIREFHLHWIEKEKNARIAKKQADLANAARPIHIKSFSKPEDFETFIMSDCQSLFLKNLVNADAKNLERLNRGEAITIPYYVYERDKNKRRGKVGCTDSYTVYVQVWIDRQDKSQAITSYHMELIRALANVKSIYFDPNQARQPDGSYEYYFKLIHLWHLTGHTGKPSDTHKPKKKEDSLQGDQKAPVIPNSDKKAFKRLSEGMEFLEGVKIRMQFFNVPEHYLKYKATDFEKLMMDGRPHRFPLIPIDRIDYDELEPNSPDNIKFNDRWYPSYWKLNGTPIIYRLGEKKMMHVPLSIYCDSKTRIGGGKKKALTDQDFIEAVSFNEKLRHYLLQRIWNASRGYSSESFKKAMRRNGYVEVPVARQAILDYMGVTFKNKKEETAFWNKVRRIADCIAEHPEKSKSVPKWRPAVYGDYPVRLAGYDFRINDGSWAKNQKIVFKLALSAY